MSKIPAGNDAESTLIGWKFVAITGGLAALFLTFFYMAVTYEPDYMPSYKAKEAIQQTVPVEAQQNTAPTATDAEKSSDSAE